VLHLTHQQPHFDPVGVCAPGEGERAGTEDPELRPDVLLLLLSPVDTADDRCADTEGDWCAGADGVRSEDAGSKGDRARSEEDCADPEEDPVLFVPVPVISCEELFELFGARFLAKFSGSSKFELVVACGTSKGTLEPGLVV
jgi:hypothetical protein